MYVHALRARSSFQASAPGTGRSRRTQWRERVLSCLLRIYGKGSISCVKGAREHCGPTRCFTVLRAGYMESSKGTLREQNGFLTASCTPLKLDALAFSAQSQVTKIYARVSTPSRPPRRLCSSGCYSGSDATSPVRWSAGDFCIAVGLDLPKAPAACSSTQG